MKVIQYLFLLCLACPAWAQAQTMLVSEDIPLRNDAYYEVLGEIKGQMLLFRARANSNEYEIQGFDQQLRLGWSKELELDKRTPNVVGVHTSKDDFTVFYHFRAKGHTYLKAHKYDAGANLIDSITVADYGYLFFTPGLSLVRSDDRSKALLYFLEKQEIFRVVSFDVDKMKVLWEKSFAPENLYLDRNFLDLQVDNDGNMYLVLQRDNARFRKKDHRFQVLAYFGDEDQSLDFSVPMGEMLTFDVKFAYDNTNHKLVAGGLYSDKNLDRATGYFFLSVDTQHPDSALVVPHEFGTEFLQALTGKKKVSSKTLPEVSVRHIVLRRDGGILLICERERQVERRNANIRATYNASPFIVDFYLDEAFAISLHPTGQTHWNSVMHKRQYSQDDGGVYGSFFLFKTAGALHFLFNDEIKAENTVSEYVLDATGQLVRRSLLNTAKLDLQLRFLDAIQVDAATVIIPSERRGRLKLVKLVY